MQGFNYMGIQVTNALGLKALYTGITIGMTVLFFHLSSDMGAEGTAALAKVITQTKIESLECAAAERCA